MNAVILCAGFATRMAPLTDDFPKALLPVGGKPVIDHLIGQLLEFKGLDSIYVVTNDKFFEHFIEWGEKICNQITGRGISLHILNDGAARPESRLGAAGDLGFAVRHLGKVEDAVVAAGDNIFRFPLAPYWEKFAAGDKSIVLALPTEDDRKLRRTGVLELDKEGRVHAFHEKPAVPPSNLACPALYFLKKRELGLIREYLSSRDAQDEIGYFISYVAGHGHIYALRAEGESIDIGTIEAYENAKTMLSGESVIQEY
ncbi:MAG TPA: nucleotidyltransferase family protein [Thermodesulfobacteriota bacterium]|nr:nucleotidyltransferase family protein [Thermodesulfobacteriota bacterium]